MDDCCTTITANGYAWLLMVINCYAWLLMVIYGYACLSTIMDGDANMLWDDY